jgi:hypothetical protein
MTMYFVQFDALCGFLILKTHGARCVREFHSFLFSVKGVSTLGEAPAAGRVCQITSFYALWGFFNLKLHGAFLCMSSSALSERCFCPW